VSINWQWQQWNHRKKQNHNSKTKDESGALVITQKNVYIEVNKEIAMRLDPAHKHTTSVWKLTPPQHSYKNASAIIRKCFSGNISEDTVRNERNGMKWSGEKGVGTGVLGRKYKTPCSNHNSWDCSCYIDMTEVVRLTANQEDSGLRTYFDFVELYNEKTSTEVIIQNKDLIYNGLSFEIKSMEGEGTGHEIEKVFDGKIHLDDNRIIYLNMYPTAILVNYRNITTVALDIANFIKVMVTEGVAHGDLKLDNLGYMGDDNGNLGKLVGIDWGSYYPKDEINGGRGALGTPPYFAPESFKKGPKNKVDIFSLGMIIWDALAPGWFEKLSQLAKETVILKTGRMNKAEWSTVTEYIHGVYSQTSAYTKEIKEAIDGFYKNAKIDNPQLLEFVNLCVMPYEKRVMKTEILKKQVMEIENLKKLNLTDQSFPTPDKYKSQPELKQNVTGTEWADTARNLNHTLQHEFNRQRKASL
jgi:hypothetical protein